MDSDTLLENLKRILSFGHSRYCLICRSHVRRFKPHGVVPRPGARCPVCGSLERHRLAWLFFQRRTDLFDGSPKRMLHIAPERSISVRLRAVRNLTWISADLGATRAMVTLDIASMCFAAGSFDIIYCSHVLEHVTDDRAALREFYRVLRPTGWAVVQVPVTGETTREDASITSPRERLRAFGQADHVRLYGHDFSLRAAEEGFRVREYRRSELVTDADAAQYGLVDDELFLLTKP